jgi:RsiW-degrading membrane proteinase PrsW (M82 family)
MLLLALAIAPGLAISIYFFLKDQYNREPRRHLLISFFLGFLSALLAVLAEMFLIDYFNIVPASSVISAVIMAYPIVAFAEEWSKYLMVRFYAFPKPEFDEPFDGIVYSVMVGMGFATVENIAYVMQTGYTTAIMRMFLSVPAHASFAVIMGYYLGKAKFAGSRRTLLLFTGLFWAIFWHGTYDLFLFLQENDMVNLYVSDGLLFGGALLSFLWAIKLSARAIREHAALSEKVHKEGLEQG